MGLGLAGSEIQAPGEFHAVGYVFVAIEFKGIDTQVKRRLGRMMQQ